MDIENRPLFLLFRSLTDQEKRQFRKWLDASFVNPQYGTEVCRLCDYLLKYQHQAAKLVKWKIYQYIVGKRKAFGKKEERTLTIYFNRCKVALDKFLIFKEVMSNPTSAALYLQKSYRQRGVEKLQASHLKQLEKKLTEIDLHNDLYYYHRYQLAQERHALQTAQQDPTKEPKLEAISSSLGHFYIKTQLSCFLAMLSFQNMRPDVQYNFYMEPKILEFLAEKWRELPPVCQLLYQATLSLKYPHEVAHFDQFKNIRQQYYHQIPLADLRIINLYIRNYLIRQLRQQPSDSTRKQALIEHYQAEIEQGSIFDENGFFPAQTFKNIVTTLQQFGKPDLARHFLKKYTHRLEPTFQDTVHFCEGLLLFAEGHFASAKAAFAQVNQANINIRADAKVLLIRAFYELDKDYNDFDAIDAKLNALREFVRTNKTKIGATHEHYSYFVTATKKLLKLRYELKFGKQQATLNKLKTLKGEVESYQKCASKSWIFLKLSESLELTIQ